ncbi:AAA family ATPase [Allocoleopsis franciscana]|uniref:Putative ATP-binding protein involved in virulence n=1 Tax=Allocoleopsis franciscana PCC 7113 TaxID=1173027 RepID=K9WMR3_9CYAN|nr:AAA family ATPase [Allocoleopsis franciscana]AFZ21061.1 putative ATP-binding protein involved in virulence [Allocoleopsis franciscana PCC 7113]
MHINKLHIQNFRCLKRIDFNFTPDNIVVIIGINGAGKSSVLDCIASLLIQLETRIIKIEPFEYSEIDSININQKINSFLTVDDINDNAKQVDVSIEISTDFNDSISWKVTRSLIEKGLEGDYNQLNHYIEYLRRKLESNSNFNLPLMIYYRTRRITLDSKSRIILDTKSIDLDNLDSKVYPFKINQLSAYSGSFNPEVNNFQRFFTWFRQEEDYENEIRLREDDKYRNPNLEVIRKALERFLEGFPSSHFSNLRVVRSTSQRNLNFNHSRIPSFLTITKNNQDFKLEQLSEGEKMLLMLVTDLARRLSIANPGLGVEALHGKGIVLIDEIDLHLHPQWQRMVIPSLTQTFPNCQFIVTTHSPQVLSNVKRENVFILEDYKLVEVTPYTYGRDSNSILYELMDVSARPKEVQDKINACFDLINEEKLEEAKSKLQELADLLGEYDSEIVRAKTLINFLTE